MMNDPEFARIREMLASIDPEFDPDSTDVVMLALCECGWRGTIAETHVESYNTDPSAWAHLAGRKGEHYLCPTCGKIVWRWYWLIN